MISLWCWCPAICERFNFVTKDVRVDKGETKVNGKLIRFSRGTSNDADEFLGHSLNSGQLLSAIVKQSVFRKALAQYWRIWVCNFVVVKVLVVQYSALIRISNDSFGCPNIKQVKNRVSYEKNTVATDCSPRTRNFKPLCKLFTTLYSVPRAPVVYRRIPATM